MPHVAYVRDNIRCLMPQYELIADCLMGEQQIKKRKEKYLPVPGGEDYRKDDKVAKRYDAYITRAVFYNVAQRTLAGLTGQVFLRDPKRETPPQLDPLVDDATGSGVTLDQLAQAALNLNLPFGRAGLFIDYPDTGGAALSVADAESGKFRPTFQVVSPLKLINYRVTGDGAQKKLTLVVFAEEYTEKDDGFETLTKTRWVALRLIEGVYVKEIYANKMGTTPVVRYFPKDSTGKQLDYIPFVFIGAQNNDPEPDLPPMYDLCSLNIAHYRNSADYEENVYFIGQPTPWFSNLTEEWVKNVMGGKVMLGARGGIMLPENGAAGILQVEPNTLAKEAMDAKEHQMLALGAKLIEGGQTERTATEANIDNTAESSVLATATKNVAAAFEWALGVAARFAGAPDTGIVYKLNTEFDLVSLTPEQRKQTLSEWQAGAVTFTEMRENLRRAGVATMPDDEAKAMIEEEQAALAAAMVEQAGAEAEATNLPDPNPPKAE